MTIQSITYIDQEQTFVKTVYEDGKESFGPYPASDGPTRSAHEEFIANGGSVTAYSAPPLTVDDVVRERERRLSLGFDFNFGDARGIHRIGTTPADMSGWDEVSKATSAMISLGLGSQTIDIVTDTGPATVTAMEWQQILVAAAQFRQPIWAASFVIQNMSPIPTDYTDNSYWV